MQDEWSKPDNLVLRYCNCEKIVQNKNIWDTNPTILPDSGFSFPRAESINLDILNMA